MMLLYPEVQAKAQAEVDQVVDGRRLPTIADRAQLPYVNAVLSEVLRYCNAAPVGLPHMSREDDVYGGYFIPKGTIIIPNVRAMQFDRRYYGEPDVFDPSRFLKSVPDLSPSSFVFGFGRRICPGRFMADANFFIVCTSVLATMNISPELDGDGRPIVPAVEYTEGITARPIQFPCKIGVRSAEAEGLIRGVPPTHHS